MPLARVYFGVPGPGLRRHAPRRARPRRPDPGRRQGEPAPPAARPRGAARAGRRGVHARRSSAARRSASAGRRSGPASTIARVEAAYLEELEKLATEAPSRGRAGAREGADRGRRAGLARAGRGARGPAVDVRDAVRRPGPHQHDAAALPRGDRRADPRRGPGDLPRRQPAGPDLRAEDLADASGRRRDGETDEEEAA